MDDVNLWTAKNEESATVGVDRLVSSTIRSDVMLMLQSFDFRKCSMLNLRLSGKEFFNEIVARREYFEILTFRNRAQLLSDGEHHVSCPEFWDSDEQLVRVGRQVES